MSLIVARKITNNLIIVSDTKLTYRGKERNSPKDGTIKAIIHSPTIAICFAGDTSIAEGALKEVGQESDVDRVRDILLRHHRESTLDTDFIVGVGSENPFLIEIKDGEAKSTDSCWIGSQGGFSQFQAFLLSEANNEGLHDNHTVLSVTKLPDGENKGFQLLYGDMFDAMVNVIEDCKVAEVGGFIVPLTFNDGRFNYHGYLKLFRKPLDIETEVVFGQSTPVNFSSVEDGAFSVNFSGGDKGELALHFYHGNIGVVYTREDHGLLSPTMYDMDEIDFTEMLSDRFDVKLGLSIGQSAGAYAQKSINEINMKRYDQALVRINQAINISSKTWGPDPDKNATYSSLQEALDDKGRIELKLTPDELRNFEELFLIKGTVLRHLHNHQLAIETFKEAIEINNTSFRGLYYKALSEADMGNIKEAIDTLSKCIEYHNDVNAYYSRGAMYYHCNEYRLAKKDFRKALTIDDNHVASINALHAIKRRVK